MCERPPKPDRLCECGNTIDFQYCNILKKWHGEKCKSCQQKERERQELEEQRRLTAKRTEIFRKTIPALFHSARLDDLLNFLPSKAHRVPDQSQSGVHDHSGALLTAGQAFPAWQAVAAVITSGDIRNDQLSADSVRTL